MRFNGARNCSGGKMLVPRLYLPDTRESERRVIIIESVSGEFAPRVSSRDALAATCLQASIHPSRRHYRAKFRRRARFIRLSARFLSYRRRACKFTRAGSVAEWIDGCEQCVIVLSQRALACGRKLSAAAIKSPEACVRPK